MKALQIAAWKSEPVLRDVAEPEPGPGEVIIRVAAAGACHSDLHLLQSEGDTLPWSLPFTLGHENAGWVDATGPGVTGLEIGQPVAVYGPWGCGHCSRCRAGMENYCERPRRAAGGGLGRDGGMAPKLLVPSDRLLVPLDGLDPVQAAPLTDAGLTPYHAIKRSMHLLVAGSHAVVIGAGGLGHMAVQILAHCTPATVIAVDQRQEALDLAMGLGAHHGVRNGHDAVAQVSEFTKGEGAEVVLDLVGVDDTLALGVAVSRTLGHVTLIGIGGGTYPVGFFTVPYEASLATTYWGSITELMEVVALAQQGAIKAHVQRFSLDDAPRAYEGLAAGHLTGRAVVVPT